MLGPSEADQCLDKGCQCSATRGRCDAHRLPDLLLSRSAHNAESADPTSDRVIEVLVIPHASNNEGRAKPR
jgi:hypothetical protein